ncbi:MAG: biosynthetic-type acetolactate synthase large subunit [Candidatus Saganbacteria bacterium]|nr:biosynthetic-type acetolactate synthase large subunit [Candidatus Saganbacteria bacterium]
MELTGAQALLESLKKEGVEVIFGLPGGQVLPLYDALYSEKGIRHILVRHEQGAGHAADGYARASGKVGVCLATSGPGATNLVTAIANAHMDSIPMVAITGQVGTAFLGKDSFQEADITGITLPITKHSYLVKDASQIPYIVKEAFHIASTGRPGPVLIDIPKDIQIKKIEFNYPEKLDLDSYKPTYHGHPKQISIASKLIDSAQKPMIYAGGGVIMAGAEKELLELATKISAPVTTTLMGKGAFPETHPLSLGMLGMHGTVYANYAVTECDVLIAIGARFDDRVTGHIDHFAPNAKIIHIDIDPAEIGKNVSVDIPIVGDVKNVLTALNKHVKQKEAHSPWIAQVMGWKEKHPLCYKDDGTLKPQAVIEKIYEVTKGEAIICTEVGQNQMWAAQYYKYTKPRTFISSGGLGTMGFGFPAAIGAQVACPDKIVIDIAGDGSIQMNIQELNTAVNNKLPVIIAILNNRYLGMVRQWQELLHGRRYSHTDLEDNPDFVKIAQAYGANAIRVEKLEDVGPALKKAIASRDKPTVIEFVVTREENVFPFVPAGQPINEMIVD